MTVLRDRIEYLNYAAYRRQAIPLGGGVTEAACKTVFTQRLKLSGMRWKESGARAIASHWDKMRCLRRYKQD